MSTAEQRAPQPDPMHVEDVADFLASCPPPATVYQAFGTKYPLPSSRPG